MESEVTKDVLSLFFGRQGGDDFSKRGSPRRGSQYGGSFKWPYASGLGDGRRLRAARRQPWSLNRRTREIPPRNSAREASAVVKVASSVTNLLESESESQSEPASWVLARDTPKRLKTTATCTRTRLMSSGMCPFLFAEFLKARIIPERIEHRIERSGPAQTNRLLFDEVGTAPDSCRKPSVLRHGSLNLCSCGAQWISRQFRRLSTLLVGKSRFSGCPEALQ